MKITERKKKAIAIAKDVIAQIQAGRYIAATGVYVSNQHKLKDGDLQKQLSSLKKCQVCALGSAFLSAARLFDKIGITTPKVIGVNGWGGEETDKGDPIGRAGDIVPALTDYFSEQELNHMEAAFELYVCDDGFTNLGDLMEAIESRKDRLILIMREVIRQNGSFNASRAEKMAERINSRINEIKANAPSLAIEEVYGS